MAYSVTRNLRELQRLLDREGLVAQISKPVVVEGSLAPPPSKVYPGTKCFMVTISVSGLEFHGFGPTPSIAKYATIRFAYDGVQRALSAKSAIDGGGNDSKALDQAELNRNSVHKEIMYRNGGAPIYPSETGKIIGPHNSNAFVGVNGTTVPPCNGLKNASDGPVSVRTKVAVSQTYANGTSHLSYSKECSDKYPRPLKPASYGPNINGSVQKFTPANMTSPYVTSPPADMTHPPADMTHPQSHIPGSNPSQLALPPPSPLSLLPPGLTLPFSPSKELSHMLPHFKYRANDASSSQPPSLSDSCRIQPSSADPADLLPPHPMLVPTVSQSPYIPLQISQMLSSPVTHPLSAPSEPYLPPPPGLSPHSLPITRDMMALPLFTPPGSPQRIEHSVPARLSCSPTPYLPQSPNSSPTQEHCHPSPLHVVSPHVSHQQSPFVSRLPPHPAYDKPHPSSVLPHPPPSFMPFLPWFPLLTPYMPNPSSPQTSRSPFSSGQHLSSHVPHTPDLSVSHPPGLSVPHPSQPPFSHVPHTTRHQTSISSASVFPPPPIHQSSTYSYLSPSQTSSGVSQLSPVSPFLENAHQTPKASVSSSYCGSIKLSPFRDTMCIQLDLGSGTEASSPLHSPHTPSTESGSPASASDPGATKDQDSLSSGPRTPSSCESTGMSPPASYTTDVENGMRVTDGRKSPPHFEPTATAVDPFDYLPVPDPLQFTVRMPKLAREDPLPHKPEWKKYSKGFQVGQKEASFSAGGLVYSSDGVVQRSAARNLFKCDTADSQGFESYSEIEEGSDSDMDLSLVHQIEALGISNSVHSNQAGPGRRGGNGSCIGADSLPLHFLFADGKAGEVDTTSTSGYSQRKSSNEQKLRMNSFHPLFAETYPKLCIGLPSEGPLPK